MNIFVTSKVISTTWFDDEEIVNKDELEEVLTPFRKLSDAVNFVKAYDFYADTSVLGLMQGAEMTEDLIFEEFYIDNREDKEAVVLATAAEFKGSNYKIRFELYIEERELV